MEIYKVQEDISFKMVIFIKEIFKKVNLMDRPCSSLKIYNLWAIFTIMKFKVKSRYFFLIGIYTKEK